PGQWDQHDLLEAAERLLMAGVSFPANAALAPVGSIVEHTRQAMTGSDRNLLQRAAAPCPPLPHAAAGMKKLSELLGKRVLSAYELRDVITALGNSRSDSASDLLCAIASDRGAFEHCDDTLLNAFASLDTPRARELLLGFVDPDVRGVP